MEEAQQMEKVERKSVATWDAFVKEWKKVSIIALPMMVVTVSQYLSRFASMMMVGRLDELSLSGTSIATSLTNAIDFSVLGMPVAMVLAFVFHLRGMGLRIGLNGATVMKAVLISLIAGFTNWEKQTIVAQERMFHKQNSAE